MSIQELLDYIENLCCQMDENPKRQSRADRLVSEIYKAVHSHNQAHSCYGVHDDWRKKSFEKYLNQLKADL